MYCDQQDVIDDFKSLVINNSAIITPNKINEIITQESYYIDGRISVRYQTPITSSYPEAFSILKRICIFRVSERVKNIIQVQSNATQANSEEKFSDNKVRTPNDDLEDIVKGKLLLKNALLVSNNLGVTSFTVKNAGTCAKFDVNKQQW